MAERKKVEHNFDFVGRILDIMRILQRETDECTVITQPEILDLMKSHNYLCSERTLADYLRAIMKELNPEEADGYVDKMFSNDDYKIVQKIFG